jgi:hypothetical protein
MLAEVELLINVEFCHSTFCPNATDAETTMLAPLRRSVMSRTLLEFCANVVLSEAFPVYE